MVVDSSALLAILLDEPEGPVFRAALRGDTIRLVSAPSVLETTIVVLNRLGEPGATELRALLRLADVEPVSFGSDHLDIAAAAFRRFGKGRHPAGLNFGDCLSYALSVVTGEPLLFKGNDFSATDVKRVL